MLQCRKIKKARRNYFLGGMVLEIACNICPRACGVMRSQKTGVCSMPSTLRVARAALHAWEEPCISGHNGSGTIFFVGCNLGCCYCQNIKISQDPVQGVECSTQGLSSLFMKLQDQGAHNINLVTPSHYTDAILQALRIAPLRIPVVWNSSGYESVDTLKRLESLVKVYLPDFKYADADLAKRLSCAADYPKVALRAIREMLRQVGNPRLNDDGLMTQGVLVRHLVLPGQVQNSMDALNLLADELPDGLWVSLMGQYTPCGKTADMGELDRPLHEEEYLAVQEHLQRLNCFSGYVQDVSSCGKRYIPSFDLVGLEELN